MILESTPAGWTLPETLQLLADSGDADFVAEIVAMFKTDTARRLLLLREALARLDGAQVKHQAHTIKGSAIQVGATSLAAICQQIETEARTQSALEELARQAEADFEQLAG